MVAGLVIVVALFVSALAGVGSGSGPLSIDDDVGWFDDESLTGSDGDPANGDVAGGAGGATGVARGLDEGDHDRDSDAYSDAYDEVVLPQTTSWAAGVEVTLNAYFGGINSGDSGLAWSQLSPDRRAWPACRAARRGRRPHRAGQRRPGGLRDTTAAPGWYPPAAPRLRGASQTTRLLCSAVLADHGFAALVFARLCVPV